MRLTNIGEVIYRVTDTHTHTHIQTDPTTVPSLRMRAEGNKTCLISALSAAYLQSASLELPEILG